MIYRDVIYLINGGIMAATTHNLSASNAYCVFRLKRALDKAYASYRDAMAGILKEVGIDDPAAFDRRRSEMLNDSQEAAELNATYCRFLDMHEHLLVDDYQMPELEMLSYDQFKDWQDENRAVNIEGKSVDVVNYQMQCILEDVLWKI